MAQQRKSFFDRRVKNLQDHAVNTSQKEHPFLRNNAHYDNYKETLSLRLAKKYLEAYQRWS